jgi:hypothetical protein
MPRHVKDSSALVQQPWPPAVSFLLLFAAALVVRLFQLSRFLTPDEYRWIGRSQNFLLGLVSGDLTATAQVGHPGVTTMWTGSLGILYRYLTRPAPALNGLADFVAQMPTAPIDMAYVAPVRIPTVLITAIFVVAFAYLLGRLLDDRRIGFLAGLLLTLSPFFTGASRVLHTDALATSFLTLSLLMMFGYWLRGWRRGWLAASGILAGFAFLSKSPTMFLMPFCALSGGVWALSRWRTGRWGGWRDFRRLVTDGLMWGALAWLTVFALWPAMWVRPGLALGMLFGTAFDYGADGHIHYFFGQITDNPGILFYPLMWLLRTMPFTIVGLVAWLGFLVASRRSNARERDERPTVTWMIFGFALFFLLFMTSGDKKQDRYILPIFPAVDALAAVGLLQLASLLAERLSQGRAVQIVRLGLLSAVLLVHTVIMAIHFPYYFTYYNPLLGGGRAAARWVTVGWGEGFDLAAAYLNAQPNAAETQVTSWYELTFAPQYRGSTERFEPDVSNLFAGDYAIVYINQLQRDEPAAAITDYFKARSPVFRGKLHGLEYVHVYDVHSTFPGDGIETRLDGHAVLFAVDVQPDVEMAAAFDLRLRWQSLGMADSDTWWAGLQVAEDAATVWFECTLGPKFVPIADRPQAVLESDCQIQGQGLAPGVYSLRFGIGPTAAAMTPIPFPATERSLAVDGDGNLQRIDPLSAMNMLLVSQFPNAALPADLVFQDVVRLVAYAPALAEDGATGTLHLDLYWQALSDLPLDQLSQAASVHLTVLSTDGTELTAADYPFVESASLPVWTAGDVLPRTVVMAVPTGEGKPQQLRVSVSFQGEPLTPFDSSGQQLMDTLLPLHSQAPSE